jgi:uncharacterized repeat protein (TIGR02543 family)
VEIISHSTFLKKCYKNCAKHIRRKTMKKQYQKSVSLILTLFMLMGIICVAPVSVSAYERIDTGFGDWMGYENDDGTLTLTGCRNIGQYVYDQTLNIPSEINGQVVTGLDLYNGEESFYIFDRPQYDIDEIVLPDTIVNVGSPITDSYPEVAVFSAYRGIQKLTLPSNSEFDEDDAYNLFGFSLESLDELKELTCYNLDQAERVGGSYRFGKINNLETLNITGSGNFYINYDLENLKNLNIKEAKSIVISGGVVDILGSMENLDFSQVSGLEFVRISGIENLEKLTLPSTVKKLYLSDCANLSTVTYNGDIKDLSVEELANCPKVNLPVVYINYDEDYDWFYLQPESGNGDYCNSLIKEIYIDSRRISYGIDKEEFLGMSNLEAFHVVGNESDYETIDGVLYWNRGTYTNHYGDEMYANDLQAYPAAKNPGGSFEIPSDVTCIYATAFDSCTLKSIKIPENINKHYYWDDYYAVLCTISDTSYFWDTKYLTDFWDGDIELVKNSSADDTYIETISSHFKYYTGSTYKISYNLDGGENSSSNPSTYTAGDIITLKNPTKEGYSFDGWTRSDIGSKEYYNTTKRNEYFKDLEFTANWSKIKKENPIKTSVTTKSTKVASLKKKSVQISGALKIKNAQGTVKVTTSSVKLGSKTLAVGKFKFDKNGKLTIKKGKYKKGTYKIKVKITANGNSKYKSKSISKTVTIKIK